MGFRRFAFRGLILALVAVCAAAAVLAHGGRVSLHLDVLTHFTPIYLGAGGLGVMVAMFAAPGAWKTRLVLLGAVAIGASLALIIPELARPMTPAVAAGGPGQIKLIQYNIEREMDSIEATTRWIAAQNPDIVVIEDATAPFTRSLLRRAPLHASCGQTCSVTIFSRQAPSAVEKPRRGRYGQGADTTVARFAGEPGDYVVVGVHFTWPTQVFTHHENGRRLLQILEPMPKDRTILVGDFNSTPWSFARRRDDGLLGMERRTRALFSWPALPPPGFPILPIDHVYAGSDWKTVRIERGPRLGSDHYPVIATLALRPTERN
jgi:endonuclease/exonuclease/phosphatase (EEP) superfamily protein YafD